MRHILLLLRAHHAIELHLAIYAQQFATLRTDHQHVCGFLWLCTMRPPVFATYSRCVVVVCVGRHLFVHFQ